MALATLAPIYIIVSFATLLAYRRDYTTLLNTVGQFACLFFNTALKQLIDQPRPHDDSELDDSGMPSNHSQFICFFAALNVAQIAFKSSSLPLFFRRLYSLGLVCIAVLVCYSRIYLRYHTADQVLVGAAVGTAFAVLWFLLTERYGATAISFLQGFAFIRWLRLRDYQHMPFPPLDEHDALGLDRTSTCKVE
jgi:dolichyldiphosphatase